MRCSISVISLLAPSAVCSNEMASVLLRMAWVSERTSVVIQLAMAKPAASSRAELMRLPVDICCMATAKGRSFMRKAEMAISALMLVLITLMSSSCWGSLRELYRQNIKQVKYQLK